MFNVNFSSHFSFYLWTQTFYWLKLHNMRFWKNPSVCFKELSERNTVLPDHGIVICVFVCMCVCLCEKGSERETSGMQKGRRVTVLHTPAKTTLSIQHLCVCICGVKLNSLLHDTETAAPPPSSQSCTNSSIWRRTCNCINFGTVELIKIDYSLFDNVCAFIGIMLFHYVTLQILRYFFFINNEAFWSCFWVWRFIILFFT